MILCVCLSPAIDVTYRVDELAAGGTNRVAQVTHRPGGKAVNVARVLHTLGERVRVLAPVGGATGAEFAAGLAELGIAAELVPNGFETRRTVAVVEASGTATMFVEPARIDCWPEVLAALTSEVMHAEVVVISGAVPTGAPDDAMSTLIDTAGRAGRPVLVDTSGAALADALTARPTMIKPNADELAQLTTHGDPVQSVRTLAQQHDTIVVASLGADGIIAADAHDAWRGRPARTLSGNPTGAGDALVAGLARGLRDRVALPHLLPDCIALSAAAVLSACAGEIDPRNHAEQLDGIVVRALDSVQ